MKTKLQVKLSNFLIIFGILITLTHCQNTQTNNNTTANAKPVKLLPHIDGFYIFKRNMTFQEVSKLLLERKIHFKEINLNKQSEIILPESYRYCGTKSIKDFKKIRIIEGLDLSLLNMILNKFQIGFLNDTIFYFIYHPHFFAKSFSNSKYLIKEDYADVCILTKVSEGLQHKYGEPVMVEGDLAATNTIMATPSIEEDNKHKSILYDARQFWINQDTSLQIRLQYYHWEDDSKIEPFEIVVEKTVTIEIIFNTKFDTELRTFSSKLQDSIFDAELQEENQRNNIKNAIKTKQIDSL